MMDDGLYMNGALRNDQGISESGDGIYKTGAKKEKDARIAELEQQLAIAENRCTTLRKQVEYMRLLYDGVEKPTDSGEAVLYQNQHSIDETKPDSHFFPERQQRTKQCIVSNSKAPSLPKPKANFMEEFNEGFVSELTGNCKQHVGKDPKDVVQIILSGMTKSINDIRDTSLHLKTKAVGPKKCPAYVELKKDMDHTNASNHSNTTTSNTKGKQKGHTAQTKTKGKQDDGKQKVEKNVNVKRVQKCKIDSSGGGSNTKQTPKTVLSTKSNPAKLKKNSKPLKATKPAVFRNKLQMQQQSFTHQQASQHLSLEPVDSLSIVKRDSIALVTDDNRRKNKNNCDYVRSSYQLPTVSYRMKCVPKSLKAQFNIRNIPFVAGMSTNKSHNLGMKVQETLSLIKLNNRGSSQTTIVSPECELNNLLKYCPSQIPFVYPRERYVVGHGSLGSMKKPVSLLQTKVSSVSVGTTVDYKNYQLRNVLVNLHDEFSKMTAKYDELQEQLKENPKNNPEADRELQKLEEELTSKENEINAIMALYNEVSDLKDKLTFMEKRSSTTSLYTKGPSFIRNNSNGLKMTRLLRKIEEFQDNLKGSAYT